MRFLMSEKLGPHKYKTPEGYLVCVDAILSRTGTQEYRRCELFGDACDDPDKTITVDRKADEVFSDKAMASFENKAICIEHPNTNVDVENHNDLSVGFVRDIHRGEDNDTPVMMGTLVITDKEAVEAVESGEYKELSCGYDCDIEDEHSPQQRNIRGNHVALCKQGRAGIARIVDSKLDDMAKLSSDEINTLKVMIESGAGKSLYNRLSWNKAHSIHLSQEEKDILHWHLTENEYLTNKEKTVIQKVLKLDSINGSVHDWLTDFEYGYRDGKLGTYDKWYRYNRKDEGKEYDMGIQKAKGEGYEIKNFIKGTGDSMIKDEGLTNVKAIAKKVNFGKILYTIEGLDKQGKLVWVTTNSDLYHNENTYDKGGVYHFNKEAALKYMNDMHTMDLLEQKYGREQGMKRYIKGFTDAVPDVDFLIQEEEKVISNYKSSIMRTDDSALRDESFENAMKRWGFIGSLDENYKKGTTYIDLDNNGVYDKARLIGYFTNMTDLMQLLKRIGVIHDSTLDAREYVINWQNRNNGTKERSTVSASSVGEALRKLADRVALAGVGTANAYVVSVSPNDGYVALYGKLFDLVKKHAKDATLTQDTFTVEYVKDNITHIVEVESSSLEDAIFKAKDELNKIKIVNGHIKDSSVNKTELEQAIRKLNREACVDIAQPGPSLHSTYTKAEALEDIFDEKWGEGFKALIKGDKSNAQAKRIIKALNKANIIVTGVNGK